jgi:hypothetical protein
MARCAENEKGNYDALMDIIDWDSDINPNI